MQVGGCAAKVGCCDVGLVCGLEEAVAVAVVEVEVAPILAAVEEDNLGHLDGQTLAMAKDHV